MSRIIWVFIVLALAATVLAQDSPKDDKNYTLGVDVQLVQIPVSVLDLQGRSIDGLVKDDFAIFEDGVQQDISLFKHEDVPLSVGLVIDNSGSMHNKRERVNRAALEFARDSNPEDETFIVNFDDAAYLEQDFTSSIDDLVRALSSLDTRGETALYDAVYLSSDHLKEGTRDKKALLVISDGEDNKSRYNLDRVINNLRNSKVAVYAIGLLEEEDLKGSIFHKPPANKAKEVLEKFASTTGGSAYFPRSVDEVAGLCRRIAHDLRNQYTLGYTPSNRRLDGSWRRITVRMNSPKAGSKVTVRAKEGYYAPRMSNASQ